MIAPTLVDQVVEREVSRPQEAPPPVEAQQLSQQGPPPLLLPWPLREAVEEARKRGESKRLAGVPCRWPCDVLTLENAEDMLSH